MIRHLTLLALAALCANEALALSTCGTNSVTEVQAGAIRLPEQDYVREYVPQPDPMTPLWICVTSTDPLLTLMTLKCPEAPGPLTRCDIIANCDGGGFLHEHTWFVVEAAPGSSAKCGSFNLSYGRN